MINLNNLEHIKNWITIAYFDLEISILFDAEKKRLINAENYTSELKLEFKQIIANDTALNGKIPNYTEDTQEAIAYYENYYTDKRELIDIIIQNQRNGFVLSIFSILEGQIKYLCECIESEFDLNKKLKNVVGIGYINKHWVYLCEVLEIDSSFSKDVYEIINNQKIIRNKIAHSNSIVSQKSTDIIKQINNIHGICCTQKYRDSDFYITIEDVVFLETLIANCLEFFKTINLAVDKRFGILKKD